MIVCRKMGAEGWFSANFELVFLLPLSMKIAPIYRAGKRAIQTVGSKWPPRTAKFADCPRCTLWANKRSRFKPFRPDRTTPRDRGVPGGHFGACFVGFGGQTRQKTRPEVGHSGSSVGKKMNSIFYSKRRRLDKNREFC